MFFAIIQLSVVFTPVTVAAADNSSNTYEPSEAEIEEVANMLEFIYEDSFTFDSNGDLDTVDFDLIRAKYGDSEELSGLERIMNREQANPVDQSIISPFSWWGCMKESIGNYLGIGATHSVFSGIYTLVQKKSWKAAATALIKVVGGKFTVAAVAGVLAWNAVSCY